MIEGDLNTLVEVAEPKQMEEMLKRIIKDNILKPHEASIWEVL